MAATPSLSKRASSAPSQNGAEAPPIPQQHPEELLATLFEAAPGFISSVDRTGRILFVNRGTPEHPAESLPGRSIYDLVDGPYVEPMRAAVDRVFTTGTAETLDTSHVDPNGPEHWFRNTLAPVRQAGHVVSVILDSIEITPLKNAEGALREREHQLEEAQTLAHLGTWTWEPRRDQFQWGGELLRLFGDNARQGGLRAYLDRVHPKDRLDVEGTLRSARELHQSFEIEHRIVLRTGEVRWLRVLGRFEGEGPTERLLAAAQDITEWKRTEVAHQEAFRRSMEVDTLRSLNDLKTRLLDNLVEETTRRKKAEVELRETNEKLVEAVRFKGDLLNVLSHELGNPLTPIKLQAHYLKAVLGTDIDPGVQKSLDIIERNIARVINLSKDMLDVARLESRRLHVELKPVDLAQSLRDTVEGFGEVAKRSSIKIVLDANGPFTVMGDQRRLEQVLLNLIGNAIKFTPGPGEVHVDARKEKDRVVIQVKDTGLGFTPEQAARLFKPFSRLHENTRGSAAGSGLGLYITQGIVQQHGSALRAESDGPGKGAKFWFDLPLASEARA